jgi:adenylate cyclase
MQQLKLFHAQQPEPILSARRSRRNNKKQIVNTGWDLWSQENEAEKEMVLFFLDIRNFTRLAERHQATDVIHIVRKMFSRFQHIIRIYHGRIIETSGDGFYAAFGFEGSLKDAANASVEAGKGILNTLEHLNIHTFEKHLHQRIDVGIGVHAGKVAVGSLQLGSKDHVVVMGYAVNIASRLQSATKELNNNFIISSEVFKILKGHRLKSKTVKANLKGVTNPCELHLIGNAYNAA